MATFPNGVSRRTFLSTTVAVAALSTPACVHLPRQDLFLEDLLARMTLEEKLGQLSVYPGDYGPAAALNPGDGVTQTQEQTLEQIAAGQISGYFNFPNFDASLRYQRTAVERSRLGIPLLFGGDIIYGMKTIYPVPLAQASSFDVDLCYRTARATAVEATALGLCWTFAPMIDVARDQRWGRVVEGAGEDPWWSAQFAAARVRGFQGDDLTAPDSMLACPKHFAAYGGAIGGRDYDSVDISEPTLRQVYLPPFRAAIEAGALSIMSSFNDIGGVPATANRHLLTDILRSEWGFDGFVVTDWDSDQQLVAHGFAADDADAALKSLTAGADVSMHSGIYFNHIPELLRTGRLSMSVVDEAVRRVLSVKKALGLFDNPYRSLDPERRMRDVRRPEMVALARESARKSIVLLKNDGVLPLSKRAHSIAFIGPHVSTRSDLVGPWAPFADVGPAVTLEEGVRAMEGLSANVTFTQGSAVNSSIEGGIEAAVAAARAADIVVLHLGEETSMSGESASRSSITIPPPQQALAEAVAATGKPLVVLLKHGRALELSGAVRDAQAIVCTWFLGSETGNAIADILFGDYAPQGRLPVSFPVVSGQQPFFYNRRSSGRPRLKPLERFTTGYIDVDNEALYPFGHGLGYSTVEYGETEVSAPTLASDGALTVSARLTNTGSRTHREVVQLYIHDRVASITQPMRCLKGIQHRELAPGESARVEFRITPADLTFIRADLTEGTEPGIFDVWVAPSAGGGVKASFELLD